MEWVAGASKAPLLELPGAVVALHALALQVAPPHGPVRDEVPDWVPEGLPGTVGGESGSTDIRELLLVFLKVFRAFGVFSKVFRAFGTPKLVEGCHLTTALVQWLADCQI